MDKTPKAPPAPAPLRTPVILGGHPYVLAIAAAHAAANRGPVVMTRQPAPVAGDPEERRQPQSNGRGTRSLAVAPDSYDATARTVEAVLSAGTAVRRYYFTEELAIDAEAIDLARVAGGVCPLLDTHNQYQLDGVIGRILSVRIEVVKLIGVLQFADTDAGRSIEA
ncbi:MAG: hypothetical protein ABW128_16020, partial [Rhizorhabdus sp.]